MRDALAPRGRLIDGECTPLDTSKGLPMAAASVKPIPEGMERLIPHLVIDGCANAMEFYKKAFGAEEMCRVPAPDGKRLMHAAMQFGGSTVFLVDDFPEHCGGKASS